MEPSAIQTRRSFLKNLGSTAALLAGTRTPSVSSPAQGHDQGLDQDLLDQCAARIDEYRKGDGTVLVRDRSGNPLRGAAITIDQLRHEFLFGCNFFMFGRCRNPTDEHQYRQRFAALLNYATLGFYWGAYEPAQGKPHYDYTDQVLDWCRERNITCKGHPLAWDHPASSPKWLSNDLKEVERLSTTRVREIVARFKGQIEIWDVVNEPTDLTRFKNPMNTWAAQLGAVPFTRCHLNVARSASPGAPARQRLSDGSGILQNS
jgi:hypothetical protein